MEVAVMGEVIVVEVIVIVAMPIVAMPSTMATIPGNVTTATMPACAAKVPTSDVASMPTAPPKWAHVASSKAGAAHVAATSALTFARLAQTSAYPPARDLYAELANSWLRLAAELERQDLIDRLATNTSR